MRRGARFLPWAFGIVLAAVAFALGVALGQALEDRPEPGGPRTYVGTLKPWQQPGQTATVTVRTP